MGKWQEKHIDELRVTADLQTGQVRFSGTHDSWMLDHGRLVALAALSRQIEKIADGRGADLRHCASIFFVLGAVFTTFVQPSAQGGAADDGLQLARRVRFVPWPQIRRFSPPCRKTGWPDLSDPCCPR